VIDLFQRHDLQPAPLRLRKHELDLALVVDGRFDFFHPLDLLQFALRLGSFAVLGPKAVNEFHQVGDLALLILESGQ
jgi:hypothetical protein